jgi:hypothetical protein
MTSEPVTRTEWAVRTSRGVSLVSRDDAAATHQVAAHMSAIGTPAVVVRREVTYGEWTEARA